MKRFGEIVVRFDENGIISAFGREIWFDENGQEKESYRGFYVSKERVLHDLKFYVDWYKDYLKEGGGGHEENNS